MGIKSLNWFGFSQVAANINNARVSWLKKAFSLQGFAMNYLTDFEKGWYYNLPEGNKRERERETVYFRGLCALSFLKVFILPVGRLKSMSYT